MITAQVEICISPFSRELEPSNATPIRALGKKTRGGFFLPPKN